MKLSDRAWPRGSMKKKKSALESAKTRYDCWPTNISWNKIGGLRVDFINLINSRRAIYVSNFSAEILRRTLIKHHLAPSTTRTRKKMGGPANRITHFGSCAWLIDIESATAGIIMTVSNTSLSVYRNYLFKITRSIL